MSEKQDKKPKVRHTGSKKPTGHQTTGQGTKKPAGGSHKRPPFNWLIIAVIVFTVLMLLQQLQSPDEISWDKFVRHIEAGDVKEVVIKENEVSGEFNSQGLSKRGQDSKESFVTYYNPKVHGERLEKLLSENEVDRRVEPPRTWIINLFSMMFPILLLLGIFYFMFARNLRKGAGGMLMSFGRSKHRLHGKDEPRVTFEDVAGVEEAKEEVTETIEFLKNPKKFQRLGGRIPRGVLLVGPPGCGKTLLAKAIAGEADVPFFTISGSDFVEMFVGVGASRVRDLFRQAKQNSPCIIFLDEVDAIGRKRGAGFAGGGHDEREQTLNAILVEMDGFNTSDQVIVIAATNRGDILDRALTRPGRFDRQIFVPLPDLKGRHDILKVHAKKIKMADGVSLERLARGTPMFTGADLAAIINEAAIAATMLDKNSVEMPDLEEARDKVRWGRAKKSGVIDRKEKEITAYHEAGHTLVQAILEDADPLHKVSIIPRGPMGGATFALPEKDRTMLTRRYCMALLQVCFGGRIAEELFCDDISSGAQYDIKQATRIARQMVLTWGMSSTLGLISYGDGPSDMSNEIYYPFKAEKDYSEKTAEAIDAEIRKITSEAYSKAKELITANEQKLQRIAQALLKYETLDADDVNFVLEGGTLDKPTVSTLLEAEEAKNRGDKADRSEDGKSPSSGEQKDNGSTQQPGA